MATDPLDAEGVRASAAGDDAVPRGTDVGHVHLEVTDLDTAREFYTEGLGMTVRTTFDGAVFLAAGDYHHHIGANVWNGRSAPASGRGLRWYELVVPDADALAATRGRLDAAGYPVDATDEGATVTDPDGITIRLRA
jgi:catechol 2,3-dioxygenase